MNKEGDSPDYEELYNEIRSQQKLINSLSEEVESLRNEKYVLLLDFYKGLKNIGRLYSDNTSEEIMMIDISDFLKTNQTK